jgi:hypothetical protein
MCSVASLLKGACAIYTVMCIQAACCDTFNGCAGSSDRMDAAMGLQLEEFVSIPALATFVRDEPSAWVASC